MRINFQQAALIGGTFLLTLALMMTGWMMFAGNAPTGAVATATPTEGSFTGVTPAPGTPNAGNPTGPLPTRPPFVVQTFAPLRTPQASVGPRPSFEPGATATYRIDGRDYAESEVPEGAALLRHGQSVTLDTGDSRGEPLWVTWRLDENRFASGAVVVNVDVAICGHGEGDFWEVYAPDGGEPFEYEVIQSGADGCWHFTNAPGHDLSVIGGVMLRSRMTIDYLEYSITFGR